MLHFYINIPVIYVFWTMNTFPVKKNLCFVIVACVKFRGKQCKPRVGLWLCLTVAQRMLQVSRNWALELTPSQLSVLCFVDLCLSFSPFSICDFIDCPSVDLFCPYYIFYPKYNARLVYTFVLQYIYIYTRCTV